MPAINKVLAKSIFNSVFSIFIIENKKLAKILPKIENAEKIKEIFILVLFCFKYVINPANEDNKITKVEVSTAISI